MIILQWDAMASEEKNIQVIRIDMGITFWVLLVILIILGIFVISGIIITYGVSVKILAELSKLSAALS